MQFNSQMDPSHALVIIYLVVHLHVGLNKPFYEFHYLRTKGGKHFV
jgi:hypothetical protein